MKKNILFLLAAIILFSLVGCAKLISTDYEVVEVKIVDEYYRGAYTQPMKVGKVTTLRVVPAKYRITVEYDGIEYTISGRDTYIKYKDKVGDSANGMLEIRTYDNDTVIYDIIELE